MIVSMQIEVVSPLPIVKLDSITAPTHGILMKAANVCEKLFAADDRCMRHYQSLAISREHRSLAQCPHGFTSCVFKYRGANLALTSLIPFPRQGGEKERKNAKKFPDAKLATDGIFKAVGALETLLDGLAQLEHETVKRQSIALHEIRKLNAKVKQSAERLCREASPRDPDAADERLVKIWKSAELMSQHFEVTELLANENLAALPPTIVSNFYKLFDKCVRVHTPAGGSHRISLIAVPSGYHGEIRACEKTLSIIPSELIGNAMKYSVEGEPIRIQIASHNKKCVVRVSNYAKENRKLDSRVFEKGVSLSDDHDSTGNGLYLVKLVTQQHHGTIDLSVNYVSPGISEVMFTLTFPECG